MSTDVEIEKVAANKRAADKRAADDAAASASANWPTIGYAMFIPILIIYLFVVLVICIDVSTICMVYYYIIKFQYVVSTICIMILVYAWINIIEQLPIYSTQCLMR